MTARICVCREKLKSACDASSSKAPAEKAVTSRSAGRQIYTDYALSTTLFTNSVLCLTYLLLVISNVYVIV